MLGEAENMLDKGVIIIMAQDLKPHAIIVRFGREVKSACPLSWSTSLLIFG